MTWKLSLSVASAGVGAAKLGAAGSPQIVGFFPEVERAVGFASDGETSRAPDSVLFLVPTTLSDHNLRWYLGEVVIAGVPVEEIQVKTIPEVLVEAYGEEMLLADASWKEIVAADGVSEELQPERLHEMHTAQPAGGTVILAGHPRERESVHDAIAQLDPVLLDYSQIAALAFGQPGMAPLPSPSASAADEPGESPGRSPMVKVAVTLVVAVIIVLIISFLI